MTANRRILAIDPAGKGFGFAVLEGPTHLIDWGVRAAKARNHLEALQHVEELLEYYGPDVIAIQDEEDREIRRGLRAWALLREVRKVAGDYEIKVCAVSRRSVRRVFSDLGNVTKHRVATKIGELFPELAPRVPPYRKPWMSEDYRMAIFDAVAFGLTYFALSKRRTPIENERGEARPAA